MSDSSYKLTASSRRKPGVRRVHPRAQPKSEQSQIVVTRKVRHAQGEPRTARSRPQSATNRPDARISNPAGQKHHRPAIGKAQIPPTNTVYPTPVRTVRVPVGAGYPRPGKKSVRVRKQPLPKRVMVGRRSRLKPMARNILYALRLLIIGVGLSAIVGTALSVLDPAKNPNDSATSANPTTQATQAGAVNPSTTVLTQEIPTLKTAVQNLVSANPNLTPGVFVLDLTTGAYVDINAGATFPAASTIKIPILIAFFQEVDAGKIRLDESLTMQQEFVAGGSGDMQYKPVGTKYTALEVAAKMMTISDNTATNMLIHRLGGAALLNQRFQSWGLATTQISNLLPDLEGTNTTTPKELGQLMTMLNQGNLVNMVSRDRILDIMRQTVRDSMLPSGIGQDGKIAHKTGDIRSMIGDAGLVDIPAGKRYAIAVMVQRPDNDSRAERLVAAISRAVYQQFTQPTNPSSQPTGINPTPNISNTNIPTSNIPSQNQIASPSFNPTSYYYQNPVMSPQMTTPGYQTYQTPVIAPQYYYPYQR